MATGIATTNQWTNADGLTIKYYIGDSWAPVQMRAVTKPEIRQAIMDVDLTKIGTGLTSFTTDLDNDGTTDGFNTGDFFLPAGSTILRAIAVVTEAAAGGTSFTLGTYQVDGTVVDADSLITATEGVLANVGDVGARLYGAGAYITSTAGTVGPTYDEYPAITVTGTFTSGKLRILLEYLAGESEV